MTARAWPIRSIDRDNMVALNAYVKSSEDRDRSSSAYHHIKVGVAHESAAVDWLGEWSQSSHGLTANTRAVMTGADALNFQLEDGDEIVVWHDSVGSPASVEGISVEIKGTRLGSVGDPTIERRDGEFPSASVPETHLFSVASEVDGGEVGFLADQLNGSGVGDWSDVFAIPASAPVVGDRMTLAVADDEDTTTRLVNTTSFADGNVSVTVSLPDGVTTMYVHVTLDATFDGNAAAGALYAAIGDGTTEHNTQYARTNGVGFFRNVSTSYAATITADTTFTARFKYATATMDVVAQHMAVSAQGLYD